LGFGEERAEIGRVVGVLIEEPGICLVSVGLGGFMCRGVTDYLDHQNDKVWRRVKKVKNQKKGKRC